MTERLDTGDLDAALGRVDVYSTSDEDLVVLVCDCFDVLRPDISDTLLDIVNAVAEHVAVCPLVQLPSPFGPPSDFGWRTCHGCGGSRDDWGSERHRDDCPGVCVRENCRWDHKE
jgi:hypothetical protein